MTNPSDIEDAFIKKVQAIPGLIDAIPYEPQNLPRALPVVTLLFVGAPQATVDTGFKEVTWHWKVNLYISLQDFRKAQNELKRLIPLLLDITRDDPRLGHSCDWATMSDEEEEPIFQEDDRWLLKRLDLRAKTLES
jgi:hypothetical protein